MTGWLSVLPVYQTPKRGEAGRKKGGGGEKKSFFPLMFQLVGMYFIFASTQGRGLALVKKLGGKIIKINRTNFNKNHFSDHISEKNIKNLYRMSHK